VLVTCKRPPSPEVCQQKLLALGEFDRRNIGAARDLGDAVEIGRDLAPAPAMGNRFELRSADPAGGNLSARADPGFAEPWALRRCVGLRPEPDVELARLGIEPLHRFSRTDGRRHVRCSDNHSSLRSACYDGSAARANSLRSATSPSSRSMP
jgi:hypothetical protein